MNVYKNLLAKVKVLLKEDDQLTKVQCEMMQWQLLVKIKGDFSFNVGKGGVNTIFYSSTSTERAVCYPDEMLTILEDMAKGEVFAYIALNRKKEQIGYSINRNLAKKIKGAAYLAEVNYNGKRSMLEHKVADLYGKRTWQPTRRGKK